MPVPQDRPARLRDAVSGLYTRYRLCGTEIPETLYVWSYRDEGAFHEAVTNQILEDLENALSPRYIRLTARFNVRGGIYTTVVAEHRASRLVSCTTARISSLPPVAGFRDTTSPLAQPQMRGEYAFSRPPHSV